MIEDGACATSKLYCRMKTFVCSKQESKVGEGGGGYGAMVLGTYVDTTTQIKIQLALVQNK